MAEEAGSLVEGALRIARKREEEDRLFRSAASLAESTLKAAGDEGIAQNTLIELVQAEVPAPLEVAAYVVDELRANGVARRDRQTGVMYPVVHS